MKNAKQVLRDLVEAVNVTGGIYGDSSDDFDGPVADPEWYDLSMVYLAACAVLGVRPKFYGKAA